MATNGTQDSTAGFAPRLREALNERGMTGHELALRLGVSDNTVSSWLRGTFDPRYLRLVRIANALGTDLAALVGDGKIEADAETPSPRAAPSDAIVKRLADLDLEPALEALKQATPDLLDVLQDAKQHVRHHGR